MTSVANHRTDYIGSLPLAFGFSPADEAVWRQPARSTLKFRDLGLHGASYGLLDAQHMQATAAGNREGWHRSDVELLYIHVMAGTLKLRSTDGEDVTLATGDTVILPPFGFDPDVFGYDADFEALEFTSNGSFAYIDAFMAKHGLSPGEASTALTINREDPASYIRGDGPRSFFTYRDIGATAATGRRMHIHIVGIAAQPPGGTGWHTHTMDQFFMPFTGWLDIWVDGLGKRTIKRGDAMYIPAGIRHNVTAFSPEYTVVEVCIPTDYDTISATEPAAA